MPRLNGNFRPRFPKGISRSALVRPGITLSREVVLFLDAPLVIRGITLSGRVVFAHLYFSYFSHLPHDCDDCICFKERRQLRHRLGTRLVLCDWLLLLVFVLRSQLLHLPLH